MLNALQKISRDCNAPKEDNLVDMAGWALNAEMCEAKVKEEKDTTVRCYSKNESGATESYEWDPLK
jgi:hypothetical protein